MVRLRYFTSLSYCPCSKWCTSSRTSPLLIHTVTANPQSFLSTRNRPHESQQAMVPQFVLQQKRPYREASRAPKVENRIVSNVGGVLFGQGAQLHSGSARVCYPRHQGSRKSRKCRKIREMKR